MSKAPRPRQRQRQVGGVQNGISMDAAEADIDGDVANALDYTSSSSIIEFLAKEQDCNIEPADPDAIFQEVSRLTDHTDTRSVDELILEAERLIKQQLRLNDGEPVAATKKSNSKTSSTQTPSTTSPQSLSSPQNSIRLNTHYTRSIEHVQVSIKPNLNQSKSCKAKSRNTSAASSPLGHAQKQQTPNAEQQNNFVAFVENLPSESVISEESTPKDLHTNGNANGNGTLTPKQQHEQLGNTDDDEDTMEELTEVEEDRCSNSRRSSCRSYNNHNQKPIAPMASYCEKAVGHSPKHMVSTLSSPIEHIACSVSREHALKLEIEQLQEKLKDTEERLASVRLQSESLSQTQRALREHNGRLQDESEMLKLDVQHLHECAGALRKELQSARQDRDEAIQLQTTLRSELETSQQERRRAAEIKQKDGRLIQDLQRQCREMERILMRKHPDSVSALIIAAKNPGYCTMNDPENTLSSRQLLEQRIEQLEADAKEQDCKAQKILSNVQARFNSVQAKYERHIADLETQVLSLQEINTKLNEQIESQVRTLDRFMQKRADRYYNNCTQTDDILTQFEPVMLHYTRIQAITTGTQTQPAGGGPSSMRDHGTNTIGCPSPSIVCQQHLQQQLHSAAGSSSSTSSTANSTPNTSRPNSKQSGNQRRMPPTTMGSKLPISQSDSTLSLHSHGAGGGGAGNDPKADTQLVSSVRNMRVDLAIKNKAMQRLTRELDDCKKTIRKLTLGGAGVGAGGSRMDSKQLQGGSVMSASCSNASRRPNDNHHHYPQHYHDHNIPAMTENQALKEAQNKFHLLEADYKTLHDKRLHDLKTLQSAHERELASSNETVRILQQRLNEREEAFATQKRRKIPVDYYALKAKVSLLERRHSEREERLHMLVDALSKGRLNGALEDMLQENNNK